MLKIITVEIICPATSRSYDFRVSSKIEVSEAKKQIIHDICVYEDMEDMMLESSTLLFSENEQLYENMDLASQGIHNGDRLYLV